MDLDLEQIHASIHAQYRQALFDAQWALAQATAQNMAKDSIIAEQNAQITALTAAASPEPATEPDPAPPAS